MTYDPTDEDSIEQERAFRAGRNRFRADAWTWLASDARGRIVLAEILLSTGVYAPSFVPGHADLTAFNEGKRAVGIGLRAKIGLNLPEFLPDIEHQLKELVQDVGSGSSEPE